MLKRFEVKNFKNFKDKFVFDLSETKNYEFNDFCIKNGIAKESIVYGPNACGKTNLGYAIFDIKNHLTDCKIAPYYQKTYINLESAADFATFKYFFKFNSDEVEYAYSKSAADILISETLLVNGETCCHIDRRKSSVAEINIKGTENLKKDFGQSMGLNNNISLVNYILNNSVLSEGDNAGFVLHLMKFYVEYMMCHISKVSYNNSDDFNNAWKQNNERTNLEELEEFLNVMEIPCHLVLEEEGDNEKIYFEFKNKKRLDFYENASAGTLSLTKQFLGLKNFLSIMDLFDMKSKLKKTLTPFVFVDEFDAYYHFEVARKYVQELSKKDELQIVLTTHNTSIMSNDLLRPDCYFVMSPVDIKPIYYFTEKELRKAHNIEKMYKAGVFNGK